MESQQLAKWWAVIAGVSLIAAGLLGFISNPIVGEPESGPIFVTGLMHNIVHILTGAIALYIGLGLTGRARANALIAFGVVYTLVLVLTLVDGDLFGLLNHPVNMPDHLLHAALALLSIAIGYMARSDRADTVGVR